VFPSNNCEIKNLELNAANDTEDNPNIISGTAIKKNEPILRILECDSVIFVIPNLFMNNNPAPDRNVIPAKVDAAIINHSGELIRSELNTK
jgi:hypothetical protein